MVQALLLGASMGLSAYSAYSSYTEGKELKEQYAADGRMLKAEAYREAVVVREEGFRFSQSQKMAYIGSGVQVAGTPLITIAQTQSWAEEEAKATERRGDAQAEQMNRTGRAAASEGRAKLFQGITGMLKTGASYGAGG